MSDSSTHAQHVFAHMAMVGWVGVWCAFANWKVGCAPSYARLQMARSRLAFFHSNSNPILPKYTHAGFHLIILFAMAVHAMPRLFPTEPPCRGVPSSLSVSSSKQLHQGKWLCRIIAGAFGAPDSLPMFLSLVTKIGIRGLFNWLGDGVQRKKKKKTDCTH